MYEMCLNDGWGEELLDVPCSIRAESEPGLESFSLDAAAAFVLSNSTTLDATLSGKLIRAATTADLLTLASCTKLVCAEDQPEAWLLLRQVEAFFKKNVSIVNENAIDSAVASFVKSEQQCRDTNDKLLAWLDPVNPCTPPLVASQILLMRRAIAHLLGDFDEFRASLAQRLRLTPGATADRPRARSVPFLKITRKIRAPKASWPLISAVLGEMGLDEEKIETQYFDAWENRVEFVDKNLNTKRSIACEGTHAVPIQLAWDGYAKERLLKIWCVDLSSQVRGQQLARLGSIDGSYSTIDLERASDTVAYLLVLLLFPRVWWEFLVSLRCKGYRLRRNTAAEASGDVVLNGYYEKFSSMGNGTTFGIETIIFGAACIAVGASDFSVYGDDIAITRGHGSALLELLDHLGFTPNTSKTFHTPLTEDFTFPFRESCGCDWFRGRLVTPFYLRKEPSSYADFHHAINGLCGLAGNMWPLCRTWTEDWATHVVPYNSDTRTGVFVDVHSAYLAHLVKASKGPDETGNLGLTHLIPFFWGQGIDTPAGRQNHGLRPYLHWFMTKDQLAPLVESFLPLNPALWNVTPQWLTGSCTGVVVEPRITSLSPSDEFVPVSKHARIPLTPLQPTPPSVYWWTSYLKEGRQLVLKNARIPLSWH